MQSKRRKKFWLTRTLLEKGVKANAFLIVNSRTFSLRSGLPAGDTSQVLQCSSMTIDKPGQLILLGSIPLISIVRVEMTGFCC